MKRKESMQIEMKWYFSKIKIYSSIELFKAKQFAHLTSYKNRLVTLRDKNHNIQL